jgi:hypothetical protein
LQLKLPVPTNFEHDDVKHQWQEEWGSLAMTVATPLSIIVMQFERFRPLATNLIFLASVDTHTEGRNVEIA